jgi:cytochrome c oxidase subunit 1
VPKLANKPLFSRKLGLWQAWTWFIGMALMSNGLHVIGLNFSVPRRTMLGVAPYASSTWQPQLIEAAIGGTILGISGLLYYTVILGTVLQKKKLETPIEMPVAEPYHPDEIVPAWLDTWKPWIAVTVLLILVAYGPILFDMLSNIQLTSPGFKPW